MRSTLKALGLCLLATAMFAGAKTTPAQAQVMEGWYVLKEQSTEVGKLYVEDIDGPTRTRAHWVLYGTYRWPTRNTDQTYIEQVSGTAADLREFLDSAPSNKSTYVIADCKQQSDSPTGGQSSSGRKVVGFLYVPPHPKQSAPYEEHWLLLPEYNDALAEGTSLSIEPVAGPPDVARQRFADAAEREDVTYRRVVAQRAEIDVHKDDSDATEPTSTCAVAPDEDLADFRSIWQTSPSRSREPKLVGFVRRPPAFVAGDEDWCLNNDYVYPSPSNGVVMELRPASRGELARVADAVRAVSESSSRPHRIRVQSSDIPAIEMPEETLASIRGVGVNELPTAGCALDIWNPSRSWVTAIGLLGLALAHRRAGRTTRGRRGGR